MTPELYAQLYPASPIARARNVQVPVLLLLGFEDRRVINVQGRTFLHALRRLEKKVELLMFEGEGHSILSIDGIEVARVEASMDWFDKGHKAGQY